jgi:hypothetical protein
MDTWDNFQDPAESFAVNDNSLFKAGVNVLEIEVLELGVITALDYAAQVTYSSSNTVTVALDIKPTSCPNPLNTDEKGVLPVAVLGMGEFDVTKIDPASVKLEGVSPMRWSLEDVATPFLPLTEKTGRLDCTTQGGDGFMDLTLKFDHRTVMAAMGAVTDGQVRVLRVTGNLKQQYGGAAISGEDVAVIVKKK